MRFFTVFLFAFAIFATLTVTQADDLAGGWKGTWTKDGEALQVTVTFARVGNAYSGAFDSDALQVTGIPIGNVSETGGRIHFEIKGDETTTIFDGEIRGDTISGAFIDGSSRGSFKLVQSALPAPEIKTRDVMFGDGDVTLAGIILLPAESGKHPAVLFLQGSGPEGRWANHYLAQKLAERGIVALIYDKRGVGNSTGDWEKVGFDSLADDAAAGVRFLRSQPEVDVSRVGIYGHSQGGTIAPVVGVRSNDLGFIIASSAGGIDPAVVETYSIENSIDIAALPPSERADAQAYVRELVGVAFQGNGRAVLDAMAARFKGRKWYFPPPPPGNFYWLFAKNLAGFKPAEYWRQIKCPVLLVYGAHDERVPPRRSADAIEAALKSGGNAHVTLHWYPNADHTFTIVVPPRKGGWPQHEPDYADMLVSWILARP